MTGGWGAAILAALLAVPAGAAVTAPLVMMPVKLLDTSGEGGDHSAREAALAQALASAWAAVTGGRRGPTVTADAVSRACPDAQAQCLMDLAGGQGGGPAAFLSVHKTSNLILTLYASIVDPASGRLIAQRELSFRGDNDTAWRNAGAFAGRSLAAAALGDAGPTGQTAARPASGANSLPAPPANPPAPAPRH